MCLVFISEQIANFAQYNANFLVFITEMKSVYCAARPGSLNKGMFEGLMGTCKAGLYLRMWRVVSGYSIAGTHHVCMFSGQIH